MMFHDYYLRGPNRDAVRAALLAAGLTVEVQDEDGQMIRVPADGVSITSPGEISIGGEWDAEGNELTPPTPVPGWHTNLRLVRPLTEDELTHVGAWILEPSPETPYRVWA
ncbi:hypothetical protein K2O51_23285 [Cupriavidus pinatubonensis]|uniref:hypothetical protein n=1 Tax=Cupriavidus pinatubonensis TaxID=248026 RepID=UPI001C73871A|nr:hypothetical protein [Cupriavidus pinatubonensis]QYY30296.1 hypothetical protein K2O51_23285 [Cupriavidus pinatubonensis]